MNLFASERIIFVRERSNGYYHPFSYFISKILFDIFPLRVLPPIFLGIIIYPMVGLSLDNNAFFKFLTILVLFNLTSAAICLLIGIAIKENTVANLIGILVMLFSLLFAGLFLNRDSVPLYAKWLQYLSIFHYAYEALIINEVKYLTLTEYKYGLQIQIPGSVILTTFGFDVRALWRDLIGLGVIFVGFIVSGYGLLYWRLVEKR